MYPQLSTGWWFGTWLLFFPEVLGIIIIQLTNSYFSEGFSYTTNQICIHFPHLFRKLETGWCDHVRAQHWIFGWPLQRRGARLRRAVARSWKGVKSSNDAIHLYLDPLPQQRYTKKYKRSLRMGKSTKLSISWGYSTTIIMTKTQHLKSRAPRLNSIHRCEKIMNSPNLTFEYGWLPGMVFICFYPPWNGQFP